VPGMSWPVGQRWVSCEEHSQILTCRCCLRSYNPAMDEGVQPHYDHRFEPTHVQYLQPPGQGAYSGSWCCLVKYIMHTRHAVLADGTGCHALVKAIRCSATCR
jgi:hypothetical protein